MSKILIIRLSAIGDIAMTIPVIYSAAASNPKDSFTVLTQTCLMPLFINSPDNVSVVGINTKTSEKSFFGFFKFALRLKMYKFDMVLDLHNVIRSRIVDIIFRLYFKKVFVIDKCRGERKKLVALPPKEIHPLRPVVKRYADVFRFAGFSFEETFISLFAGIDNVLIEEKKGRWIGIAPFAKHKEKIYPLEKMEKVVKALSEQNGISIFLFGGHGKEEKILSNWEKLYKNTTSVVGCYSLDMELSFMSNLDVMLSMDSANMHLASLAGTRVISVWGATHPYAGFYGYNQREDLAVQVDLPCRPCSIYGNKPCFRGDRACMNNISTEQIVSKINGYLAEI